MGTNTEQLVGAAAAPGLRSKDIYARAAAERIVRSFVRYDGDRSRRPMANRMEVAELGNRELSRGEGFDDDSRIFCLLLHHPIRT